MTHETTLRIGIIIIYVHVKGLTDEKTQKQMTLYNIGLCVINL